MLRKFSCWGKLLELGQFLGYPQFFFLHDHYWRSTDLFMILFMKTWLLPEVLGKCSWKPLLYFGHKQGQGGPSEPLVLALDSEDKPRVGDALENFILSERSIIIWASSSNQLVLPPTTPSPSIILVRTDWPPPHFICWCNTWTEKFMSWF